MFTEVDKSPLSCSMERTRRANRIVKRAVNAALVALPLSFADTLASTQDLHDSVMYDAAPQFFEVAHTKCRDYTNYIAKKNFSVVSATCGQHQIIWLLKPASRKTGAGKGGQVVDQRKIRPLREGENFLSGPYCYDKSGKEVNLSGIFQWKGKHDIQPGRKVIVEAWIPDIEHERFQMMSKSVISGIRCSVGEDE